MKVHSPQGKQVMGLAAFTCHSCRTGVPLPDAQKQFQHLTGQVSIKNKELWGKMQ